ncbi:MAG: tRNA (5-methylaminomethyl-2-thiouridine)(34)-methyltransferase MnmD [Rubellimicrobium sp.]|nr:tRNA (5-methylaminomethyl-2-thiouridine)(34)-methyltransferase MnmD [Rubellimicrobium sp.]
MAAPDLDWSPEGTPVSRRFGDPYFSRGGGLDEARHVFLAGNDLPARFRDGFRIAELGFGTGLNLLATLAAWRGAGMAGLLHYTAFELDPLPAADMARALAAFPGLAQDAQALVAALAGGTGPHDLPGGLRLAIITGDARETLPRWNGMVDAWFLDGFAPARNPELWGEALLAGVAARMAPGATLATYTAAGHVRRALAAAGLTVARAPGFGRKRHMTRAWQDQGLATGRSAATGA